MIAGSSASAAALDPWRPASSVPAMSCGPDMHAQRQSYAAARETIMNSLVVVSMPSAMVAGVDL